MKLSAFYNRRFDIPLVGPSEMTVVSTKGGNLHNIIMYNIIWANQKTESFVYHWLCGHAMFDVTCFPAFVVATDVILSIMSIH